MFGNRRLAKRSILGTRICAPYQDGRFLPGVIESQRSEESLQDSDFTVVFDNGEKGAFKGRDLVGPGFQQINELRLRSGQKVFLTLNGREIFGTVISHSIDGNEIQVAVKLHSGDETVVRKIDEIRLMESRKSARLQDQDTDYSRLADLHPESKKRIVSHVIDVPTKVSRVRHSTSSSTGESTHDHDDTEMMDDHMAAMVLTSLSVSPVSPIFPQSPPDHFKDVRHVARSNPDSFTSSGFLSSTCHSDLSVPSPPLPATLSESAPSSSASYVAESFPTFDEGIDLEENIIEFYNQNDSPVQKPKRTMYKCTFPRCGKIFNTCPAVEKHVRNTHLDIKDDSSDLSDHEEEFYYTEIEVTVENVTQTFSDMSTSSPPTSSQRPVVQEAPILDHDYNRKVQQGHIESSSFPSSGNFFFGQQASTPIPINMSEVKRSLSWQISSGLSGMAFSPMGRSSRPSPQERLFQHQAQSPKTAISSSPKQFSQYKKARSDVRKCRKVYGMENRDMWCTQCKWKKACTRFMD